MTTDKYVRFFSEQLAKTPSNFNGESMQNYSGDMMRGSQTLHTKKGKNWLKRKEGSLTDA